MKILEGHLKRVDAVAFSPDTVHLASCSKDGTVRLWDLRDGWHRVLGGGDPGGFGEQGVAFSPDGRWLAHGGFRQGLCVWEVETGRARALVKRDGRLNTSALAFSPGGWLAAATWQFAAPLPFRIRRWQAGTWEELTPLVELSYQEAAISLAIDPSGGRLVLGNGVLLDARTGERVGQLGLGGVHKLLAWSPGRPLIALGGSSNAAQLFDVERGSLVGKVQLAARQILGLAFTPDGRWLLTVSNEETVKAWETASFRLDWEYAWELVKLKCVAAAPDGMRAAAGTNLGQIVVWDLD
jgi:WD40 repeat protein